MANDKEETSIIVKDKDLRQAEKDLGNLAALKPKLTEIAAILAAQIFGSTNACELDALNTLRQAATQNGLPSQPENLKSLLVALRENDLIDDVSMASLWRVLPAYRHTPTLSAPTLSRPRIPNVPSSELDRVKLLFEGVDRLCPTSAYLSVVQKLDRKSSIKKETANALTLQIITPELAAWFVDLEHTYWQESPMTLASISTTLKSVKNIHLGPDQVSVKNAYASQKRKKSRGLSNRLAFYQRFNSVQIDFMSKALQDFMTLHENLKRLSFVPYDNNGKIIPTELMPDLTNPAALHRASIKFLHHKFADEMSRSALFAGHDIVFEDLVLAGLETGVVIGTSSNTETLLKIDDSWNPPTERGFKKIIRTAQTYGSPLLILIPSPYNLVSSLGLNLLQTTILKSTKKPDPVAEGYSVF